MNLEDVNIALFLPIIVVQLILMIVALIDLARRESTRGPKWLWVLVIIFLNILGPVLYFTSGRRSDS